jgi:hypothetical protein
LLEEEKPDQFQSQRENVLGQIKYALSRDLGVTIDGVLDWILTTYTHNPEFQIITVSPLSPQFANHHRTR